MEGKRNRGEVTAELSEKVWARLCRENALVASEVWVDDASRVDFVAYRPHRPRDRSSNHATAAELESGTFTFVEVKSCMDDFTSGHGRTFEGDENWLVCPLELADSLASKGMLPKGAAVYSPDARGALRKRYDTSEFRQVRVAPAIELIWAMLRRKSSCETGAGFPVWIAGTSVRMHIRTSAYIRRGTYAHIHIYTPALSYPFAHRGIRARGEMRGSISAPPSKTSYSFCETPVQRIFFRLRGYQFPVTGRTDDGIWKWQTVTALHRNRPRR